MARRGGRVKTPEKLCLVWVVAVTFCVGLAVVVPQLPLPGPSLGLLLFLFLEFLPLLLFLHTVSQPAASPYLLLPWIIVNTCLILFSSILVLSLSISHPTKRNVFFCLILSVVVIFPIATAVIMSLPLFIFLRRRVPGYRRRLRQSKLFRTVTQQKSAEELEAEILARRREQIRNTIVTDKSYEQFIYVNRAAAKWRKKVDMKKRADTIPEKSMFAEGNVTVNVGSGLDTVEEETLSRNPPQDGDSTDHVIVNGNGVSRHNGGNRMENGKMVTDV